MSGPLRDCRMQIVRGFGLSLPISVVKLLKIVSVRKLRNIKYKYIRTNDLAI
jgi:hypothetical protein